MLGSKSGWREPGGGRPVQQRHTLCEKDWNSIRHFMLVGLVLACGLTAARPQAAPADDVPAVKREFRGVWVATVGNIDWPSRRGLSTAQQQDEMRVILDRCVELKLNAVVFQ